jgi:hypothetical protein
VTIHNIKAYDRLPISMKITKEDGSVAGPDIHRHFRGFDNHEVIGAEVL